MLWDLRRKSLRIVLTGHTRALRDLAFSPNGGLLASASADGTVKLWDVESGALVHPRSFGAMPEFLERYVRDDDVVALEVAVQKITGGPATKLGLTDRGTLEIGKAADLVIFDPDTIANRATLQAPYQYPEGIRWVIVNGKIAINPDGVTGNRAGVTIRRSTP